MRLPRGRFTRETVTAVFDHLFSLNHVSPFARKAWEAQGGPDAWVPAIVDKHLTNEVEVFWEPIKAGGVSAEMWAQYVVDARNKLRWPEDNCVWLAVWLFQRNLPRTDSKKVNRVVSTFKELVRIAKPTFAAVDYWAENMVKRRDEDPRRFAWGAMYYDAAHAERIGADRLRNCSALIKEEWPDDSFWIQAWQNPFIVVKQLTQQFEKELGLKQAFPEEAATPTRPKAKAVRAK